MANKKQTDKKKIIIIIAAILVLAAIIVTMFLVKRKADNPDTNTTTTSPLTTEEKTTEEKTTEEPTTEPTVEWEKSAEEFMLNAYKFLEKELNENSIIGYQLIDLNEDGTPEIIINEPYTDGGNRVNSVAVLKDGEYVIGVADDDLWGFLCPYKNSQTGKESFWIGMIDHETVANGDIDDYTNPMFRGYGVGHRIVLDGINLKCEEELDWYDDIDTLAFTEDRDLKEKTLKKLQTATAEFEKTYSPDSDYKNISISTNISFNSSGDLSENYKQRITKEYTLKLINGYKNGDKSVKFYEEIIAEESEKNYIGSPISEAIAHYSTESGKNYTTCKEYGGITYNFETYGIKFAIPELSEDKTISVIESTGSNHVHGGIYGNMSIKELRKIVPDIKEPEETFNAMEGYFAHTTYFTYDGCEFTIEWYDGYYGENDRCDYVRAKAL